MQEGDGADAGWADFQAERTRPEETPVRVTTLDSHVNEHVARLNSAIQQVARLSDTVSDLRRCIRDNYNEIRDLRRLIASITNAFQEHKDPTRHPY